MLYRYTKEYIDNLQRQKMEIEKRKLEAFEKCEILGERPLAISYTGNQVIFALESTLKIKEKIKDLQVNGILRPEWFDIP